jgi:hypothetical protein
MRSNAIRYYPDANNQYKPVSNNKNGINSMAFYKAYKPARKSQVMKYGLPKIVAFK